MAQNQNSLASKRKRRREDYTYLLEYRTRWSDNDVYGHLNNSIYAFLIDSIVNAYLIEQCDLVPQHSKQIGLVVNTFCDFFGSTSYPSVLELGLRVVSLGNTSVTYEVGVFEKQTEDVRVLGGSTHVFVERESRKPAGDGMKVEIKRGLTRLLGRVPAKL